MYTRSTAGTEDPNGPYIVFTRAEWQLLQLTIQETLDDIALLGAARARVLDLIATATARAASLEPVLPDPEPPPAAHRRVIQMVPRRRP